MGTSGLGRFSDYSASGEEDKCTQVIDNEPIENYGDYDYGQKSLGLPVIGTKIHLEVRERIVIIETATAQSIGALSTSYEYLRSCIKVKKYEYNGQIKYSDNSKGTVDIRVDLIGTKPKK